MSREEGVEAVESDGPRVTRTNTYPLNSRRLIAEHMTRIAKGLGLPTGATLADLKQMIEGKLAENYEPRNVQVDVVELGASATAIKLRDEGGVILEIPPEEESRGDLSTIERAGSSSSESEHEGDGAARDAGFGTGIGTRTYHGIGS